MFIKTVPIGKVLHKQLLNFFCQLQPGVTCNSLAYKKAKK